MISEAITDPDEATAEWATDLLRHGVEGFDRNDCWQDYCLSVILRVLFMPMWFWVTGSPASWWRTGLDRAMEAVEDLRCLELPETQ
jgi:hypothetical protein